jgi:hypothetical protein
VGVKAHMDPCFTLTCGCLVDAGFSPRRPLLNSGCLHVRYVEDEVALELVLLPVFMSPLPLVIPPSFYTHLSPPDDLCDN